MTTDNRGMTLLGSALTDVGQIRSHNEDSVYFWSHQGLSLAVVADGMGGAAAGEEASRIVIETVQARLPFEYVLQNQDSLNERDLRLTIQAANLNIIQHTIQHPTLKGMGTTVTLALVQGRDVTVAHVGDSRAYHISPEGEITQITSDHSFVQALLDAGHITEEQAETHPMGNVLYRALGQTEDLEVDTYYMRMHLHDRLLLCSDGLTRHVRRHEIAQLASQSTDPYKIAKNLITLANMRGGEDNISVIVVYLDGDEEAFADHVEEIVDGIMQDVNTYSFEDEDTLTVDKGQIAAAQEERDDISSDDLAHPSDPTPAPHERESKE